MTTEASSIPGTTPNDDEEMRKLLRPLPDTNNLLQTLHKTYSGDLEIVKELDSYDDRNYLVLDKVKQVKYLCKVYNGVASKELLQSEKEKKLSIIRLYHSIYTFLSINAVITAPQTISTPTNDWFCTLPSNVESKSHSPQTLVMQMLSWVEGTPLSSCETEKLSIKDMVRAGVYLGRLCLLLDEYSIREEKGFIPYIRERFSAWDVKNTRHLKNFVGYIEDSEGKSLVQGVLKDFEREVLENSNVCKDFRMGMLHGDFNDANIIMKDGCISGVIDFGDCCYSWRVLDIAIGMAYAMLTPYAKTTNKSISAAAAMLCGFHSIYPLTSHEIQYLRLFMSCRLAMSVTYGTYTYATTSKNEYILLHMQPAWKALRLLCAGGEERKKKVDDFFVKAASLSENENDELDCLDIDILDDDIIS